MKYYVSVNGQLNMPYETYDKAKEFAEYMEKEGFDTTIYTLKEEGT